MLYSTIAAVRALVFVEQISNRGTLDRYFLHNFSAPASNSAQPVDGLPKTAQVMGSTSKPAANDRPE